MNEEIKQIGGLNLTDKQIKEYFEEVYKCGSIRKKEFGEKFNEVDFALGASMLLFVTGNNDRIPASFVLSPLWGKEIFEPQLKEE
ncbi:MAG TPA: hypothetical protein DHN29_17705 [Cytophagales bacterium]|nr:hypothetical protein [Cytophagales bacterium]|tara:strand:+ start:80 stop:334 length:255 start_codon:yes stop_codon:yes gene_type:complete